jgi:hypothetical protein
MDEISNFAKIHQYDDRKVFKEEWQKWKESEDIAELIEFEIKTLVAQGFKGNILDKMFKSARYYFRKKKPVTQTPKQQREYIGLSKIFLDEIDIYIQSQDVNTTPPAIAFEQFNREKQDVIQNEKQDYIEQYYSNNMQSFNENKFEWKIKKTYKNKFYSKKQKEQIMYTV